MIVDFHTHVVPPRMKASRERYLARDRTMAALLANPAALLATAEELIAAMDEAQVDVAVTLGFGWTDLEVAREANDYLLDAAARYPKRLVPFCSVNPAWGETALREVERCARQGARGVGELHPDSQELDLGSWDVMGPLVELLRGQRLILLTHASEPVGHDYPGKGKTTPAVLLELVRRAPSIPIVCAHWGGGLPFYALMPEVQAALRSTYFDTAASPLLYRPEVVPTVVRLVGASAILLGSDYPLLRPERQLRQLRAQPLAAQEREAVLGGNAARLLGLSEGPKGDG
ncbi:MAG: amidohydrolase [Chloroflexi bacterium]|nr:amidohydrolase [Chloroflexota bacterium]